MKISTLKLNPNNPRIIKDDKFEKLVKSITDFPAMMEKRPIVCVTDSDGKIYPLGGNMRLKAIKEIGYKEIPDSWVMIADEWSEEQRKEFVIKDNVGFGEWDFEDLKLNWDTDLLATWGLDIPDFAVDEVLESEEDNFEVPEGSIETDIVIGDLFEIGEHRLLCGDSTDSDAVAKLMNGEKADMVFTDPPYGVSYKSNHRKNNSKNQFDVLENDDKFLDFKANLVLFAKESSAWFIWTSHQVYPIWREMYEEFYLNTIIWDKGKMGMGDLSSYGNNYEMALFCSQGKPKLKGERKKSNLGN